MQLIKAHALVCILFSLLVGLLLGLLMGGTNKAQPSATSTQTQKKSKHHQLPVGSESEHDACQGAGQDTALSQSTTEALQGLCQKGEALLKKTCEARHFQACETLFDSSVSHSEEETGARATILRLCATEHDLKACQWVAANTDDRAPEKMNARTILLHLCLTQHDVEACIWSIPRVEDDSEAQRIHTIIGQLCTTQHNVDACDWVFSHNEDESTEQTQARKMIRNLCNKQRDVEACIWIFSNPDSETDFGSIERTNLNKTLLHFCTAEHNFRACEYLNDTDYLLSEQEQGHILTEILDLCTTQYNANACKWMLNHSSKNKLENQRVVHALEVACKEQNNATACDAIGAFHLKICH